MQALRYDQFIAVNKVADLLTESGFEVVKLHGQTRVQPDLKIIDGYKGIRIKVKNLKINSGYKNSSFSHLIYKIEVFDTYEERDIGVKNFDYVIGYSLNDFCFACVPVSEFRKYRSIVIHEKGEMRHEYFNNLKPLLG